MAVVLLIFTALGSPACPFLDTVTSPCHAAVCAHTAKHTAPSRACREFVRTYCTERRQAVGWAAAHATDPGCFGARDLVCPFGAGPDSPCTGWLSTKSDRAVAPCSVDPTSTACRALADGRCRTLREAVVSGRADSADVAHDIGCFSADMLRGVTLPERRRITMRAAVARAAPALSTASRHAISAALVTTSGALAATAASASLALLKRGAVMCAEQIVELRVELDALPPAALALSSDALHARQRAVAFEPFRRHLGSDARRAEVEEGDGDAPLDAFGGALPQMWVAWTSDASDASASATTSAGGSRSSARIALTATGGATVRRRAARREAPLPPRRDASRVALHALEWRRSGTLRLSAHIALPHASSSVDAWAVLRVNGSDAVWGFVGRVTVRRVDDGACGPQLVRVTPEGLYVPSRRAVDARKARAAQRDAALAALKRAPAAASSAVSGARWGGELARARTRPSLTLRANSALAPLLAPHLCGGDARAPCDVDPALLAIHAGRGAPATVVEVTESAVRFVPSMTKPFGHIGFDVPMTFTLSSPRLAEPLDFTAMLLAEPASLDALLGGASASEAEYGGVLRVRAGGAGLRVDSWSLRV